MIWMKRGAMLYKEDPVDWPVADGHGIEVFYVDERATNAAAVLADVVGRGHSGGLYFCASEEWWPTLPTPAEIVAHVKERVRALIPQAYPLSTQQRGAPVMLNYEPPRCSKDWLAEVLRLYRVALPSRETCVCFPARQDQTVLPLVAMRNAGVHWYVELFYGDMSPDNAAAAMLQAARLYPPSMVGPCYDGAALPSDWIDDGVIFVEERIPA